MLFSYQDFYCSGIDILSTADYFYNILFLLLETAYVLYERLEQKYSPVQHLILIWKWLTWFMIRVGKRTEEGDCTDERWKKQRLEHCWLFLNVPVKS